MAQAVGGMAIRGERVDTVVEAERNYGDQRAVVAEHSRHTEVEEVEEEVRDEEVDGAAGGPVRLVAGAERADHVGCMEGVPRHRSLIRHRGYEAGLAAADGFLLKLE